MNADMDFASSEITRKKRGVSLLTVRLAWAHCRVSIAITREARGKKRKREDGKRMAGKARNSRRTTSHQLQNSTTIRREHAKYQKLKPSLPSV
jgi:hypothetical protein